MSKERLEKIKKELELDWSDISYVVNQNDVKWLIKRLEQVISDLDENVAAFETLWLEEKRKNQRYKQALEFYAEPENYCVRFEDDYEPILQDNGKTARQVLGWEEEK